MQQALAAHRRNSNSNSNSSAGGGAERDVDSAAAEMMLPMPMPACLDLLGRVCSGSLTRLVLANCQLQVLPR